MGYGVFSYQRYECLYFRYLDWSSLPPVRLMAVDEAHCISEWSHSFRPAYMKLHKYAVSAAGAQCFVALTATATVMTREEMKMGIRQ